MKTLRNIRDTVRKQVVTEAGRLLQHSTSAILGQFDRFSFSYNEGTGQHKEDRRTTAGEPKEINIPYANMAVG